MEKTNKYIVILTIVLGLFACYYIFKIDILIPIALGIALISILSSYLAGKIVWVWEKTAMVLGVINSKILLSVIFFVFLVPVALFSRLFKNKDTLTLKKKTLKSYYKDRNHKYSAEDLEEVF